MKIGKTTPTEIWTFMVLGGTTVQEGGRGRGKRVIRVGARDLY